MAPLFPTLLHCLRQRASERPGTVAYTFVGDDESDETRISYQELDRRARAIAAALQRMKAQGERAVLLYPPGLDYVAAFLGCLYAKTIAVPAYPPDISRLHRSLPRLQAILQDSGASILLTNEMILSLVGALEEQAPQLRERRWLATDTLETGIEDAWREPEVTSDTLAFLQYTSGSTGTPKGVMLTHSNLVHNSHLIGHGFELGEGSVAVNWLPPYHDMGLIGGILQPLYNGFHGVLLSPITFLQRPLRWLQAISRHGGTCAGGPNFAFDLCVRKIPPEQREGLKLSTWDVAFCGAEPIRAQTFERFAQAFAPQGFRPEFFYPCYGLAEATLLAAGGIKAEPVRAVHFDTDALQRGHGEARREETEGAVTLVSSGMNLPWQTLTVVDAKTNTVLPDGQVGELWMTGPSVASGYWERPEETARVFGARLASGEGPFLRTGDLAFLQDGQLFITGRLKDLLIIRGRNHYPQDLEKTLEESHPAIRPGCSAAFAVDVEGEERLVVAVEVNSRQAVDVEEVSASIRQAISEHHELSVHAVLLLQAGTLPKTSSGKVQRHACRNGFLDGSLELVGEWRAPVTKQEPSTETPPEVGSLAWLRSRVASLVHMRPDQLAPGEAITRHGLDSLQVLELHADIERALGVVLPLSFLMQGPSLEELEQRLRSETPRAPTPDVATAQGEPALSHGQRALWFLHELAPDSTAYHVSRAVRIRSELDPEALRKALQALVDRHPALRTRFVSEEGQPRQQVLPSVELPFHLEQAAHLDDAALQARISAEAERPFDLRHAPLLRVHVWTRPGGEHVLLLTLHHVVTDFWSLAVLADELGTLYTAARSGTPVTLPPLPLTPSDHARQQHAVLASETSAPGWSFWEKQLAGKLPVLELPTDKPRPPTQTFRGASRGLRLGQALTERLRDVARAHDTTLYTVLVAAFHALLHRHTGQDDLIVGSPTSGRTRAGLAGVVGYFANPVPLRARFTPDLTFSGLISQMRATVLGALEHQDIPFPALVERLHPERDAARSPIFQALLVLQKSQLGAARGLAGLALEEPGEEAALGELRLESWPLPHRAAQFELSLALAETREGLSASMEYNTDLFEAGTIDRMLGHLRVLWEALAARPEQRVTQPALLTAEEFAQQAAWNDTATVYEGADTLHGLVEAQSARTPDAVAVRFEDETLTYRELELRANQLAHHLRGLGVGPEVRVGVCMERSLELVVGLLGVLKAGGAYVPLDPSYPRERLNHMLRDSAAPVLLTQERLAHVLPESGATRVFLERDGAALAHHPTEPPAPLAQGENLAYVIYTSGSTGVPKGAMNTHAAIRNRLLWMQRAYGLGASDHVLQKTPFSFDVSVWEFFWPLLTGARLVLARPGGHQDPTYLRDLIAERRITTAHFVPSMLQSFLDEPGLERCASLRHVVCSGEALSAELRDRCLTRLPGAELHNLYGPTEAAVDVSAWTCRREDTSRTVPIGRPVANTRLLVLDARWAPVPVGVPGELYIGGIQVGRGYLGRPELTAAAFVPDPSGGQGARLYKTGDRARFLPDGNIEYLGRLDSQVKLRGLRIELGEIEATLESHPAVRQAAVLVREAPGGDRRLVAFLAPAGTAPSREELKDFLGTRLPAYMLPSGFGFLEELPLGPSGKLDRRALASLDVEDPSRASTWLAPRTSAEEKVAHVWSTVLGRERIGANDHFFELGGHSLLATQAVSRLRSAFGVELPLQAIFEAPTVAALARRLESTAHTGPMAPPLVRRSDTGPAPLSFAQERLWLVDQMVGGGPLYNMPCAVRLRGPLDLPALERALSEVVRRHEALRTVVRAERGEPVQEVLPAEPMSLTPVELADLPELEREDKVEELAREEALRPFDLARGPLLRAKMLRLAREHHVLLLTMHHIVSDGWSVGVLARELTALYGAATRGEPSPLEELPLQYGDYSLWQKRWLEGGELERQLGYWKRQLDALPRLQLRTDRPRPAVQSHRGRSQRFLLPRALVERLEALGRGEGATLFMVLLGVFDVVLERYSGQDDLVVGTDVANRNRPEIEGLIGFFTNQLVLRTDLSGDPSFRELLGRLRRVTLEAYEHQDVPFERLVRALRPERDAGMSPLFQVKLVLQNAPAPSLALPGLRPSLLEADGGETARWDLLLDLSPGEAGLWARAEYSTDLFDEATIARLWEHFLLAAEGVAADPGRRISATPLVTADERESMARWNDTGTAYPRQATVHGLFEAQAAATPDAVAVTFEGQRLTYAELDQRANQLAHHLLSLGVSAGGRVGLCLERSVEMVVGLLGILKAGCAYLPLDPSYPIERLSYLIQDGRLLAIVTRSALADELPVLSIPLVCVDDDANVLATRPATAPTLPITAGHEAYVLYTSGSTGIPKGVAVPHRAVVRLVRDTHFARFGPDETLLQLAPLAFDASTLEVWGALLNGGRLAVFPPHTPSLEELSGFIAREGITTLWLTAGLFHQLVDHALEALAPVRQLLAGGDVLSPAHVRRVVDRHPHCQVINGYGPTENTTFTCCYPVPRGEPLTGSVPVGRPISNTHVHVLDTAMAPVPVGAPGELYAGGDGLALGYLNAPELTAERFVPDPFSATPGARLYRTGDLCRLLPDGRVEFLGRVDQQVKIRGFRIEPGEIEAMLATHPELREARVMAREDVPGEKTLVAYVVAKEGAKVEAQLLRSYLQERLPAYLVPSAFVTLTAFPLTANGKVDWRALPAPENAPRPLAERHAPPRTPEEEVLVGVWREVLGRENPGIDDNFFDDGGDSIRAIQFVARASERGLRVPVGLLLEYPSVRGVAESLREGSPDEVPTEPTPPFGLISPADRERLPPGVEDAYPVATLQGGMLFQSQVDATSALYHDAFSFHLELTLDVSAFEEALRRLLAAHPVLRTSFDLTRYAEPLQLVHHAVEPPLSVHDLRHLSAAEQETHLERWLEEDRIQPFDWSRAPLMRVTLHQRTDTTVQLSATFHHAILDGWSVASLFTELLGGYVAALRGEASTRQAPALPFREFIALERRALQDETTRRFWTERLDGLEVTSLTRVMPRRPEVSARGIAVRPVSLSPEVSSGLRKLARQASVPLKSVLLAAHLRVLGAVCGTNDVVTGLVSNGRPEVRDGEKTLGLFLNSLPLRQQLEGGTWVELVRRTFAAEREVLPHRRSPMGRLQQRHGGQPLFEALFNFVHFHVYQGLLDVEGVRLVGPVRSIERLDLPLAAMFGVDPVTSELQLALHHDTARLDEERVHELAGHYARVLEAMATGPEERHERFSLLTSAERERVLVEWNATQAEVPAQACVHHLFEAQAARTPEAPALTFDEHTLTYRELDARATRLAARLRALGVGPDDRVAVALERSAEMVVAMLGVLKAGGAYMPLDPAHPPARLETVLREAHPAALVTHSSLVAPLPEGAIPRLLVDEAAEHDAPPPTEPRVSARNLACVLYTSGSTGRPKGVMVDHGNLVNHFVTLDARVRAEPPGTWLAVTPYTFDISGVELVWTLTRGFHVVIHPEDRHAQYTVSEQIERHGITHLQCTPSRATLLLQQPDAARALGRLRTLVLGGEALTPALATELREFLNGQLLNIYGPTETTIWSTTHGVDAVGASIPIGRPVGNTAVYIVDRHGVPVPPGVPGELLIGGAGVSRGYLRRPELTAERFVPDPLGTTPGGRLYRTGDLCRYLPDGTIEFLGRLDHQVKIRGYRIELGELESVLREDPAVREAAVVALTEGQEPTRLVAYLGVGPTSPEERQTLLTSLRAFLRERVPEYMVPSAFVVLDALPLNSSGKLDRRALPSPQASTAAHRPTFTPPSGQLEQDIAEVWCQELRLDTLDRDEKFFDVGGNSLLAARVQVKLQEKLGREVPLLALFTHPTVSALARHLSEQAEAPLLAPRLEAETQRRKEGMSRLKRMAKKVKADE